jgi:hypothetical protein
VYVAGVNEKASEQAIGQRLPETTVRYHTVQFLTTLGDHILFAGLILNFKEQKTFFF